MVYPKHHIRGLEGEWLLNMGSWKSYVSLAVSTLLITVFIQSLNLQPEQGKAYCGARFFACFCDREFMN